MINLIHVPSYSSVKRSSTPKVVLLIFGTPLHHLVSTGTSNTNEISGDVEWEPLSRDGARM
jgi:hypothetical protein